MSTSDATPRFAYDLFVSYAHADDHDGWVGALVESIQAEHATFTSTPLTVFFDADEIRTMHDWEHRIYRGLRHARLMLAILSPRYFASAYCRKEWERYLEQELGRSMPNEGIAPIYTIPVPGFEDQAEETLDGWLVNLRRRQYVDLRPWRSEGPEALRREEARARLRKLDQDIDAGLKKAERVAGSTTTIPPHNPGFVGRVDELRQVRERLAMERIGAIAALHGIGGIGKSALAFEYAHAFAGEYPGGRFLVPCAGATDLRMPIIALAEHKGIVLADAERQNVDAAFARVRAAFEQGERSLLLLDNVDDPGLLAPHRVAAQLPAGDNVHVLVTTRLEPERLGGLSCVALESLPDDDALRLLEKFRPFADDDEWKAALRIVHRLGGHPLALEVVGVFLWQNPEVSYAGYAARLEREGLQAHLAIGGDDRVELSRHRVKLLTDLLAPTLDRLTPAERLTLEYAALLPPDQVAIPWLKDLVGRDHPELTGPAPPGYPDSWLNVLRRLHGLRLLIRGETDPIARMHRLVQDVVRDGLGAEAARDREATVHQHADDRARWLESQWGQVNLAWELPSLRDLASRLIDRGDRLGYLICHRIATPLAHTGRILEARMLWRHSASLFERRVQAAPENADYARDLSVSYERLGDLARALGDAAAARGYYEDGLVIRRRLSAAAPENADYARGLSVSYERLGDLALALGDAAAARGYYEDGLVIRRRLSAAAPENADYARGLSVSYNKLGDLARALGDAAGARGFYEDGLVIRRRLSAAAPENADYARGLSVSYERLGDLALALGDAAAARGYYEDGLVIRRRLAAAAPENADYARGLSVSYERLGDLARALGDAAAARGYYEDGLVIRRRLSAAAPENADYARDLSVSYDRLGDLARALGDAAGARGFYEDGLVIRRRLSAAAPENADYARDLSVSYNKLGDLARALGDAAGARGFYEDGLVIRRRLSAAAPENADYARDLSVSFDRLGDLARALGDAAGARGFYEDGLVIARRLAAAAAENADYARDLSVSYNKLGDLARALGDAAAARGYHEDGLVIRRRLSGAAPENADYARDLSISYDRLGDMARALGDAAAARGYYEDGLVIARRLSGAAPENADYARDLSISYERLGDLARDDGDLPAARHLYEDSLAIWRRLSRGSPENADSARGACVPYARLADLAERESDSIAAESWWRQAYEVLAGMKRKGLFVSAEDEGFLRRMEEKLGIPGGRTDE